MNSMVLLTKEQHIAFITLNNIEKHNAFDDGIIKQLTHAFESLITCIETRVIVLQANGKNFCAGADLNWMKRMKEYSMEVNEQDSLALAQLLSLIHHHPKTVIGSVQGSAFGGGVGLVAACDFAVATEDSRFCFSEVKLGLIPAVISPFVINAIGSRLCKKLFLTAELLTAQQALSYQLIQTLCKKETLKDVTQKLAQKIANNAPIALGECKKLVNQITLPNINEDTLKKTSHVIAALRVSKEGQEGLSAFLEKRQPKWN